MSGLSPSSPSNLRSSAMLQFQATILTRPASYPLTEQRASPARGAEEPLEDLEADHEIDHRQAEGDGEPVPVHRLLRQDGAHALEDIGRRQAVRDHLQPVRQ